MRRAHGGGDGGAPRPLLAADEVRTRYYLRIGVADRPGVLGQLMTILGAHQVSIAQVIQDGPRDPSRGAEATRVFVITHEAREGDVRAALAQIDALPVVLEKTRLIRIAG
jgi:homoserine dehydrogenase